MTDRELLELAAKAKIADLAIAEHRQWLQRNQARDALKRKLREAELSLSELSADDWETEEWADWQAYVGAANKAQSRLNARRVATRRAIVRAAAEIGKAMK